MGAVDGRAAWSAAVNISGRDLEEGHLLDRVRLVLEETGLDPAWSNWSSQRAQRCGRMLGR